MLRSPIIFWVTVLLDARRFLVSLSAWLARALIAIYLKSLSRHWTYGFCAVRVWGANLKLVAATRYQKSLLYIEKPGCWFDSGIEAYKFSEGKSEFDKLYLIGTFLGSLSSFNFCCNAIMNYVIGTCLISLADLNEVSSLIISAKASSFP